MKIEYKNYVINQTQSDRFDLLEKVERTKKDTEEKYEAISDMAYDVRLEHAINLIVHEELRKKEEVVTLKEFIEKFNKIKEELLVTFNI